MIFVKTITCRQSLKNFLTSPVKLIFDWLEYFNISVPARAIDILKDMKICSSFMSATAVFPKMVQVVREGPQLEGGYVIVALSKWTEYPVKYFNSTVRSQAFYFGFASTTLGFIKYLDGKLFDLPLGQKTLLSKAATIVSMTTAGLNLWAEAGLRRQIKLLAKEEKYLSLGRGTFRVFQLADGLLKLSPYAKSLKFPKLVIVTGLTGLSFFNYLYEKRVVEPLRKSLRGRVRQVPFSD